MKKNKMSEGVWESPEWFCVGLTTNLYPSLSLQRVLEKAKQVRGLNLELPPPLKEPFSFFDPRVAPAPSCWHPRWSSLRSDRKETLSSNPKDLASAYRTPLNSTSYSFYSIHNYLPLYLQYHERTPTVFVKKKK